MKDNSLGITASLQFHLFFSAFIVLPRGLHFVVLGIVKDLRIDELLLNESAFYFAVTSLE